MSAKTSVIVYHSGYGCDTGCCGHVVEMGKDREFYFDHPGPDEDHKAFAMEAIVSRFGEAHVKDLDWANCQIVTEGVVCG